MSPGPADISPGDAEFDPFAQPALARVVPTTEAQREIWLAAQLAPEASLAYNEAATLRLRGALDASALQTALAAVVQRHDALRATFGDDGAQMYVVEQATLAWQQRDLAADAAGADAALAAACLHAVETPFDLAHGPLFRAALLRVAADAHVLLLSAHHIVCDGWSWGVIVDELAAAYRDALTGQAPDTKSADSFADFAVAENAYAASAECTQTGNYWTSRFAAPPPPMDLPADRPRPRLRGFASQRCDLALDAPLVQAVAQVARRNGTSLYAALLATFAVLLQRLSGQDDLVIGVPAAGQAAEGHAALVGHAVNILPLRVVADAQATFAHTLAAVRGDLLDAFDHQRYTFGTLLKHLALPRDPSRLPLVSVLFNLDRALDPGQMDFGGLAVEFASVPRTCENFELFVNAVQQPDGGLVLECQFATGLYDTGTISAWLDAYATLLRGIAEDATLAVDRLPMLSVAQAAQLESLQPLPVPYEASRLVHEYFERQADRSPRNVAVSEAQRTWTYAELEARANRIAQVLHGRGVGHGQLVGLALARSPDMIAALLAVLKAGAGYVPLDPDFPAGRLAFMAQDAALAALIVDGDTSSIFDFPADRVLSLRRDAALIDAASPDRLPDDGRQASPESVAYVIYTSGSTGKPKGVRVPHGAASNFISSMQHEPGITEHDRLVAVTTLSFDIAFLELMLPLSVGATIVLASRDDVRDGAALRRLVESTGATMMQATPAGWRVLLESGWEGSPDFRAITGGEPLPLDLAEALLARCRELWNAYGPTETTVWSTLWRVHDPRAGITIGHPIGNTRVHVLDEHGVRCPLGAPGEIYIGGDGVTLGYLNRPDLTADRFLPDPFGVDVGARMYRTGDRGRWLARGELEHLGRVDFQVKIRGYRIELGEIETALAGQPEVARAVAVVREDRPGDIRLVAYVTLHGNTVFDEASLRARLRGNLPEYMVPQHLVVLDSIPQLPNGKIDRRSLPAPQVQIAGDREHAPPRDEREARIAEAMEQILALPGIGIYDDFFALGGHSLLAAQLTARLNRDFDVSLSLRVLFDTPTVAGLAETVAAAARSSEPRIQRLADQHRAPLSRQQERLWIFEQVLAPGTTTYNSPSTHRLRGPLDEAAFQRAFDAVVQRQSVLRTSVARENDTPVQIVHDTLAVPLFPAEDLGPIPDDQREAELLRRIQALTDHPFRMNQVPLFRARMFRLADDEHVLFFMPHHIVWDGWSFDLFYDDFATFYRAFRAGTQPVLPPLPYSYGDYAAWHQQWQEGSEATAQRQERIDWWRGYLTRCGASRPLPTDFPRNAQTVAGPAMTEVVRMSADSATSLRHAAATLDTTVYTLLVGAYALALAEFGGVSNVVIGTPVRVRPLPELEKLMGHFTNMLPLGLEIDRATGFDVFAAQVRQRVLDTLVAHDMQAQDLTKVRELRDLMGGQPLFGAQFSFQDARARQRDWAGLAQSQILIFQRSSGDDLGAWLLDHGEGMVGGLLYRTDLFKPETGRHVARRWMEILESIAEDPHQAVGALLETDDGNAVSPAAGAETSNSVPALFAAQTARTPDRIAIEWEGGPAWTYAKLQTYSQAIARELLARGVAHGELVGVCLPRRPEMLAAVLGVQLAGAAYVALDPAFPAERLRYMAEHSGVHHVLTWDAAGTPDVLREFDLVELDGFKPDGVAPAELPAVDADDLAYVLYTSGSTGKPKGVCILQGNLVNFLASMRDAPGIGPDDVLCAVTTLCFDIAVLELYLPLLVGARIVIATEREQVDPVAFPQLMRSHGVTVLQTTPTLLRLMLNHGQIERLHDLKLLVGGEALPRSLANAVLPHCRELWNLYGPTETTVWSTIHRMVTTDGPVPLGKPIANTVIHALDDARQPVADGTVGEIWIGGAGVAGGYLHDPAKTAERFLIDPFVNDGSRMYRTGDLGHLADGVLYFDGRADDQIKLRGYRIEPGDIEAVALAETGVQEAVAVAREIGANDKRLLLYVAAAPAEDLADRLRARLREYLPAYMVPQHIQRLDALPHTPNGKIDRKSLPLPSALTTPEPAAAPPPVGALEQALMDIWRELLRVRELGVNDDFFDLGGDSLLAVRVFERTQKLTGVNLPLASLLTAPTIARQAAALRAAGATEPQAAPSAGPASNRRDPWALLVPIQPRGARPPIFFVHAIGGNVLNYVRLAKGFHADQPVYGLQALGLDGITPPLESVDEMATRYAAEIRKVQPHGPYFLAGGSMGGAIAYEIAQRLLADGEAIGMLALFDTYGPADRRLETAGHRTINLQRVWGALRGRVIRVADRVRVGMARRRGQSLSYDLRHREIERAHRRAYMAYVPAPLHGTITLFRANSQPPGIVDRSLGWEASALGGVEIIDIPGHHDDLVEQPELMEQLRAVLRRQRQLG